MSQKPPATVTSTRRTLVIALVVVVTLLIGALVAGEAYARHKISRCISTQFEKDMGSKIDVGFGWRPMLLTLIDGKVSRVTVDSADSKFGPAVGMVVHARFKDLDVENAGQGGGTINSSSADVTWNNDGIRQTLGGLVSDVHSSSSSGMLTLDVLGGLAQLQVQPRVTNGVVQVDTMSAELLGMGLPTDLVQGIVDVFTQSLQSYPMGLKATDIKVTDDGIAVKLEGGRTELEAGPDEARC
ncbi:DUF2993 domain-containing protein [Nocardia sp. NBC_01009]|uniref:LmeA family phospholipid-binding protein n=1 Tax=Nocardia sp. NBC_01009 TaxID=2975996 RepID=UPI00386BFFC7|nr:DUF2993 domain-containing protein [Nocardia sp. NBC_01009]